MRTTNLLFTLTSVIMATLLMAIGIFAILWPFVPHFRASVIYFLQHGGWIIPLIGFLSIAVGAFVVAGFYLMNKRSYYHLTMGESTVVVDEAVVQGYLQKYWSELFPSRTVPTQVRIRRNKIHISSDLPYVPFDEQKDLLQKVEAELNELFADLLDYRTEFFFSASFEKPPEEILEAEF